MKFNLLSKKADKVMNYEGAQAWKLSPEWQLYTATVTSSLSEYFYQSAAGRLEAVRDLIAHNDPRFVARLAIYARTKMNMRSMPLVLAVELARVHSGDSVVSRMVSQVVRRADEITELLAYYQQANAREDVKKLNKLSRQIQAGLKEAFNRFDEYQFAKYNRDTEVKLKDALFLVHPKAKDEAQQLLFDKIVDDTLSVPYTWETELSALGQVKFPSMEERKCAFSLKWEELIDSGKVGYMALLRNLRNLLEAEVSEAYIKKVCSTLASPENVRRSKQLPFRFLAAYREISKSTSVYATCVLDALEEAVAVSAEHIKGFGSETSVVLACDVSGSMQHSVSPKSRIYLYDIGLMLAMLLKSRCEHVITGMFGDTWKVINVPSRGVLANVDAFYQREGEVGYATNGHLVIKDLLNRRERIDKVMLFTDSQLWDTKGGHNTMAFMWNEYKKISPDSKLYLFDLAGYGMTPLSILREDVYLIAGWSDKIFDILDAIEQGGDALSEINNIPF